MFKKTAIWKMISTSLFTGLVFTTSLLAQDDPPGRVARLAYIQGSASFEPGGTNEWVAATPNRPLTTGDALWTDSGSWAALSIGTASINLDQGTSFSFLNLTDTVAQLQLSSGSLRIRVKYLANNEDFEVDTPNLAFVIQSPGIYRVSVDPSGQTTTIQDLRGSGEADGGGSAFSIGEGEAATFSGNGALNPDVEPLPPSPDSFEQWCEQRDHHEDVSVAGRYMSNEAIGYDDLDDYGGWRSVPNYGMAWFPHETVAGWAPYHYGHWDYIAPWGYTWVDDAPWGFAPFHYGRWISVGQDWGWVPCPPQPPMYGGPMGPGGYPYAPPVYAPALVAWIGGPHFGIGIGLGVGWFPLGPREPFVPSYPVSRNYVQNVNITNTTINRTVINNYYNNVIVNKTVNVTNVTYVNQRVPGAIAATTPQAFASGQAVNRNFLQMNREQVMSAPVNAVTPAAVPQRAAVFGGKQPVQMRPPAAIEARPIVARRTPPAPLPSLQERLNAIQSNGGHPLSIKQAESVAVAQGRPAPVRQIQVAPPPRAVQPLRAAARATQSPAPVNRNEPARQTPAQPAAGPPALAEHMNMPMSQQNLRRSPTVYPTNPQLEQQHRQENLELHQQQDAQRRQLEEQQAQQRQQLEQQRADAEKLQTERARQQAQLQALEQQHRQQQQQLEQRQEAQHNAQQQQRPQGQRPTPRERPEPPRDEHH